ncbi:MAG: CAP domain-containing protein [Natronomonas sp.]|nr:CAP domain-containing protein [Natronomonas sp.]
MRRRTMLGIFAAAAGGGYLYRDTTPAETTEPTPPGDAKAGGEGGLRTETDPEPSAQPDTQGFDSEKIEDRFLERFNAMREREKAGGVYRDRILSEMGQAHAENMAEHDYIGHTQPDSGMTIEDRFERRGLMPQCELPAGDGSGEYYPGAENVAGAAVGRVQHPGSDETFTIADNDDVARFLMDSWMSSPGHREVMVLQSVESIGLGVAIRDDGEIFAALQFC